MRIFVVALFLVSPLSVHAGSLGWINRIFGNYDCVQLYERKEFTDAADCFIKSAAKDNARSAFNLGVMINLGHAPSNKFGTATEWFKKSADLGFPDAQFNLAVSYRDGLETPKDLAKAFY